MIMDAWWLVIDDQVRIGWLVSDWFTSVAVEQALKGRRVVLRVPDKEAQSWARKRARELMGTEKVWPINLQVKVA